MQWVDQLMGEVRNGIVMEIVENLLLWVIVIEPLSLKIAEVLAVN